MPRKINLNFIDCMMPFAGETNHGFFVHREVTRFNGGLSPQDGWTVTHPASGYALGTTTKRDRARKYAATLRHIFSLYKMPLDATPARLQAMVAANPEALEAIRAAKKHYCKSRVS
jgi:hypothetical protein